MDMLILFCISCRTPPCIVSGTGCPSQECSSLLSGCKPSKMAISFQLSCFLVPDHGKFLFKCFCGFSSFLWSNSPSEFGHLNREAAGVAKEKWKASSRYGSWIGRMENGWGTVFLQPVREGSAGERNLPREGEEIGKKEMKKGSVEERFGGGWRLVKERFGVEERFGGGWRSVS